MELTTFIFLTKLSFLIAGIPLAISLLIDVCLGHPAKEQGFDSRAIFSNFSAWLAKLRLKRFRMYDGIKDTYITNIKADIPFVKHVAKQAFKEDVFNTAKEYFTWELGFGMCPVCTNIRISIVVALVCFFVFNLSWIVLILIPCFSNLYLLIFNKLKS